MTAKYVGVISVGLRKKSSLSCQPAKDIEFMTDYCPAIQPLALCIVGYPLESPACQACSGLLLTGECHHQSESQTTCFYCRFFCLFVCLFAGLICSHRNDIFSVGLRCVYYCTRAFVIICWRRPLASTSPLQQTASVWSQVAPAAGAVFVVRFQINFTPPAIA
jgi:hypothetical protein